MFEGLKIILSSFKSRGIVVTSYRISCTSHSSSISVMEQDLAKSETNALDLGRSKKGRKMSGDGVSMWRHWAFLRGIIKPRAYCLVPMIG